jgi:hypothetical protein
MQEKHKTPPCAGEDDLTAETFDENDDGRDPLEIANE